jgi:hypothetical protein
MRVRGWIFKLIPIITLLQRMALAAPGGPDDSPHLRVRDKARPCPERGAVCVTAVPPTKADTGLIASASLSASAPAPTFSRANDDDNTPWTLDVDASLRRVAWAGNALFILYDAEDPIAIETHEVTALYQMHVPATRSVSARLTLDPNDGFRPAHTYLLRIAQLIDGNEVVLAEGPIVLR